MLEVLPEFRGRGIGSQLMRLMLEQLDGLYMIDVTCDEDLVPFYRRFDMNEMTAMGIRSQTGIPT